MHRSNKAANDKDGLERLQTRFLEKPLVAGLVLLGLLIIGLGAVTGSLQTIWSALRPGTSSSSERFEVSVTVPESCWVHDEPSATYPNGRDHFSFAIKTGSAEPALVSFVRNLPLAADTKTDPIAKHASEWEHGDGIGVRMFFPCPLTDEQRRRVFRFVVDQKGVQANEPPVVVTLGDNFGRCGS